MPTVMETDLDLVLAGLRLRVAADIPDLAEHVAAMMVPPCDAADHRPGVDWTLSLERAPALSGAATGALFADRPVLVFPHGGPRLAVADDSGGVLHAVGQYRPDGAAVGIHTYTADRTTRIEMSAENSLRWVDYLARVFFASRMLAAGWRMLHASAVAADGMAVMFLAGQRGGKSTLAHRASTELGAAFLADDLVLIGPGGVVVGWPTRVALPAELVRQPTDETVRRSTKVAAGRRRVVLSRPEHRALPNVVYSPPMPLGAVVCVESAPSGAASPVEVSRLSQGGQEAAVSKAALIPAQRLYVSDALGLTGGPRSGEYHDSAPLTHELLDGALTIALRVDGTAELGEAPVWEALGDVLPQLGRL